VLEVKSLSVFHGPLQALWDVSLHVEKGEVVALIGANGAGKTTTIRTISGVLKPKTGTIHFLGSGIEKLAPHTICQLGLCQVPEGRKLFPYMTVRENLEMGAYGREAKAEMASSLEFVYRCFPVLKERSTQVAVTLSGGEQQMLAIGRALMSRPKLLMLDEPSLGLAPRIVEQIFDTIVQLNKQGVTILLVEQNVSATLEIAQRAYVLETGRVTIEGRGEELLSDDRVRKSYLAL
jgi:branched-chain amino acid transport system ATP-binding protein